MLLLCGTVPAYRDLGRGDKGKDVRQLNRNLRALGYDTLKALQRDKGLAATGTLELGDAVFLPKPVRISKVTGKLGESARPGAPVAQATSDTLEVQVKLEATQQREVKRGDRAQITLPGNTTVTGTVDRLGTSRPDRRDRRRRRSRDHPGLHQPRRAGRRRAGSTGPRSQWTSRPRE